ncbi:MAG: Ldh family oxidoreductase [Pikeienuella sp.]
MARTSLKLDDAYDLTFECMMANGADERNASAIAKTIWRAERDGAESHGLFRVPGYVQCFRLGKANTKANPVISSQQNGILRLSADKGFSPLAHEVGLEPLAAAAKEFGMATLGISSIFHFAALWPEVETLTDQGLVGMAFTSSPPYVAAAGGKRKVFGTNPMAFGWPRGEGKAPMIFDQASSHSARGEVMIMARDGHDAPDGAGIDKDGVPTNDPAAILEGAQLPFGGYKGSGIALMVELLAGPLIGEMTSLEIGEQDVGGGPALGGQLILAFDPARLGGTDAAARGDGLFKELESEEGVRLPGTRRIVNRGRTPTEGISLPTSLYETIKGLI